MHTKLPKASKTIKKTKKKSKKLQAIFHSKFSFFLKKNKLKKQKIFAFFATNVAINAPFLSNNFKYFKIFWEITPFSST